MADATGGVARIAHKAKLNPTQLYRTLSKRGNPGYKSLSAVLKAMGMRLSITPMTAATKRRVKAA
jgi:DNA-binding phage protein